MNAARKVRGEDLVINLGIGSPDGMPPMPAMILVAPFRMASAIISPKPKVEVSMGLRWLRAMRPRPEAEAISIKANSPAVP